MPVRGVLVNDIESSANRALGLVARYATFEIKDKLLRDILGELKQLKAFLGIARDTSLLERQPAAELMTACAALEDTFGGLLESMTPAPTAPEVNLGVTGIAPGTDTEEPPISNSDTPDTDHEEVRSRALARREAIMEVLKHRPKVSVGDLVNLFMGKVSRKTLQRDLQEMVDEKIVNKGGDKRWTYYSLGQ